MKYSFLHFIDSKTLREMLRGKQLEPAIECILIAQGKKQPLRAKLEALQERYDSFSEAQFAKGFYHVGNTEYADDDTPFKMRLRCYIDLMSEMLKQAYHSENKTYYQCPESHDLRVSTFGSFAQATEYFKENDCYCIIKNQINSPKESAIVLDLNCNQEITEIRTTHDILQFDLTDAYAAIPHSYQVGDLIRWENDYCVVMQAEHLKEKPNWLNRADATDMQLYCFGYSVCESNPLFGSFDHCHVPILQAEIVRPAELPHVQQPLLALSLLMRGKLRISDFLESYSNGGLVELMKYYRGNQ